MHILVVEDEKKLGLALKDGLESECYEVTLAHTGEDGFFLLNSGSFDLVVLDLMLPGRDGLEILATIRKRGLRIPVLILTARDAVEDRVSGLDAGADDYLVKPFAAEELSARVRALLRRGRPPARLLSAADLVLDVDARHARRGSRDVPLTAREADLLELLLLNAGQVVSREQALARVWGDEGAATSNVVDRYVAYLRRKLGDPPLIETVRGL